MLSMILGPLAERLVPVLQTPVEDIIYEVLDQKGLPTRAEVRDLRNKLDRLEKTLEDLSGTLEKLKSTVDDASERAAAAEERAAKAEAAPATTAKADKAGKDAAAKEAKAEPSAPVKAAPKKSIGSKVCKVDDCNKSVRAKGLCGAHYQRFKRGTLVGWVGADGTTTHDEVRYRVGTEYVGQPVETSYEGDDVLFFLPESDGKRLTLKVNDVRID